MGTDQGQTSNHRLKIRPSVPADWEILFDIWLRSVQATHTFLSEEEIQFFAPFVRVYLRSEKAEFWVLCLDGDAIAGFMGLEGSKIEALFLAPEFQRQGGGRCLVEFAQTLRGELTVDVNEENISARHFYEACGFIVEGRSELDGSGRPFPLLHLRLPS